jgi:SAM-dependent methyltransferase
MVSDRAVTPLTRFSNRVADYVRCRPSYPPGVLDAIERTGGPLERSAVADIGSGTGISSELLLERGATVYAVEPNAEMRAAAEMKLSGNPRFHSVAAPAEATPLADASVDGILAAQSFHWFRFEEARREFQRILKPLGWIAIVWNDRQRESTPFLAEYEAFLRQWSVDYGQVDSRRIGREAIERFCAPREVRSFNFPHSQKFNWEGLVGRHRSSSYALAPGDPRYEASLASLRAIYDRHAEGGLVRFDYLACLHLAAPASVSLKREKSC